MSYIKNPVNPNEPICKNIRTRANFVPALRDDYFMQEIEPYTPCFCIKTLMEIGPDDDIVCLDACDSKRACFEAQKPIALA